MSENTHLISNAVHVCSKQNGEKHNSHDEITNEIEYNSNTAPNKNTIINALQMPRNIVPCLLKLGFGLGHVHNDLCAAVWFSYTLLFLTNVRGLPGTTAGALLMLGQLADALATPMVGVLADRFGSKRRWHLAGSFIVLLSFPLIFSGCPVCGTDNLQPIFGTFYYSSIIIAFQIGWAIVQISHMSMIPELGYTQKDRADLTAIRYTASVCSSVTVYVITWAVLHTSGHMETNIGPSDITTFRDICLILTGIGAVLSGLFHITLHSTAVPTHAIRHNNSNMGNGTHADVSKHSKDWDSKSSLIFNEHGRSDDSYYFKTRIGHLLKSPILYQIAFMYVAARLFVTLALVYVPLWLDEREAILSQNVTSVPEIPAIDSGAVTHGVEELALIPLVSFIASFIASLILKSTNQRFSSKLSYLLGSMLCFCGCIWVAFVSPLSNEANLYGVAILFGSGSSITMVSSLCLTAELADQSASGNGLIYSVVTFADKLITGLMVIAIEDLKCSDPTACPEYYRSVLARVCGGATVLGLLTLATLKLRRCRT